MQGISKATANKSSRKKSRGTRWSPLLLFAVANVERNRIKHCCRK